MDAKTYFANKDGRLRRDGLELARVAGACNVSPYYLFMVAAGHKTASAELAARLEHATKGAVDRRETLPVFPWDKPKQRKKAA